MNLKIEDISKVIKDQIKNYASKTQQDEIGYVIQVGDGIAKVHGLEKCKANELLTEWKNGEHTEDSFAYMAAENSTDSGSATNGGLYEDIYPGQMVDAFDAWCFDASRKPGDTGIVKTEYGYHIMYFVSTGEHAYWYARAENDYLNELSVSVLQEISAEFTVEDTEQNAAIVDVMQQD